MIGAAEVASLPAWQRRFPALAYPNFRLWMGARVAWAFAMVAQGSTISFLAYEQTHSTAFLGYISLAYGLPILTLTLFAGVAV